jgi:hypothetical protein
MNNTVRKALEGELAWRERSLRATACNAEDLERSLLFAQATQINEEIAVGELKEALEEDQV